MAKYVQPGHFIDYVNGGESKIKAGDIVAVGGRIGIAACDIPVGAVGAVALDGAFEFDKAAEAITLGAFLYWDSSNENVTATASGNTPVGMCIKAAQSGDATTVVLIGEGAVAANVAKAASTAPTKAEFDALIDALIAAGFMAAASE